MTQHVFISLVLVLVTISLVFCAEVLEDQEVGNDRFQCERRKALKTDCAAQCDLNICPLTEHYSRVCDKTACSPGCQCRFNEKFGENGTCIPTQQCPPFPCDRPNEEYVACPSYCSESCSQGCPTFGSILMVVECFPECRCKQGFNRKDGVCVPRDEC